MPSFRKRTLLDLFSAPTLNRRQKEKKKKTKAGHKTILFFHSLRFFSFPVKIKKKRDKCNRLPLLHLFFCVMVEGPFFFFFLLFYDFIFGSGCLHGLIIWVPHVVPWLSRSHTFCFFLNKAIVLNVDYRQTATRTYTRWCLFFSFFNVCVCVGSSIFRARGRNDDWTRVLWSHR